MKQNKPFKFFGQFLSFKYTDRNEPIDGLIIDYNDDWTLLKHCPVDYIVDGYKIFKNKKLEGYRRDEQEKFREKVLKLKGISASLDERIPMTDLETILEYLTEKHEVFGVHAKSEKKYYLGSLKSIDSKKLVIRTMSPDGKWRGEMSFRPGDIRTIEFDTDYINSLKLVTAKRK